MSAIDSNCNTCKYKNMKGAISVPDEHCYMFFDPPKEDEICMQHTHAFSSRRPESITSSRNTSLKNLLITLLK